MINTLSFICNLVIIIATAISVMGLAYKKDDEGVRKFSASAFRYFTTDSNVLCAIGAMAIIPFNVVAFASGSLVIPGWAVILKYVGTVGVTLTLITVMAFLGPTQGYGVMLSGSSLYMHLIGPLIAIASFCLLEKGAALSWTDTVWGMLPTFIYGVVYLIKVVIVGEAKGGWKDFYGFNRAGAWPVSFVLLHLASFGVCVVIRYFHNMV